jgi:hypothetical protein
VRQAGLLGNRQDIHVRPQPQFFGACAAAQLADHASATQAAHDLIAPADQGLRHQFTATVFLAAQLRILILILIRSFITPPSCLYL